MSITNTSSTTQIRHHQSFVNRLFVLRVFWRWLNLTSRLGLAFLIWRILGGAWLVAVIIFELLFYLFLSLSTKQLIFFEGLVGYVLETINVSKWFKSRVLKNDIENEMNAAFGSLIHLYHIATTLIYGIFLSIIFGFQLSSNDSHAVNYYFNQSSKIIIGDFAVFWFVLFCIPLIIFVSLVECVVSSSCSSEKMIWFLYCFLHIYIRFLKIFSIFLIYLIMDVYVTYCLIFLDIYATFRMSLHRECWHFTMERFMCLYICVTCAPVLWITRFVHIIISKQYFVNLEQLSYFSLYAFQSFMSLVYFTILIFFVCFPVQ